jgi:hypothetical protein
MAKKYLNEWSLSLGWVGIWYLPRTWHSAPTLSIRFFNWAKS